MPRPNTIECRHTRVEGAVTTESLAIYSEDKKYRYLLERIWSTAENPPMLMCVMSHPSTATLISNNDDYTVEICERFARVPQKSFGGIYITNVFAFVRANPNYHEQVDDPIGTENDRIIREYARKAGTTIICAWGNNCCDNRTNHIETILREGVMSRDPEGTLNCFGTTDGNPKQPLELLRNRDIEELDFTALDFDIWTG